MRVLQALLKKKAPQMLVLAAFAASTLAIPQTATAQVVVGIGIQPVCSYGYYDYAPYGCAPVGFYGPGYFYNGIFLGMGPWAGWGYGHGWGDHRFTGGGGGRYNGNGGEAANRAFARGEHVGAQRADNRNAAHNQVARTQAAHNTAHAGGARPNAAHAQSHGGAPHESGAPHGGGGGAPHGGGGGHPRK
jgi:hypothetical protein